jgi:hypothetical protein
VLKRLFLLNTARLNRWRAEHLVGVGIRGGSWFCEKLAILFMYYCQMGAGFSGEKILFFCFLLLSGQQKSQNHFQFQNTKNGDATSASPLIFILHPIAQQELPAPILLVPFAQSLFDNLLQPS